MGHVCREHFLSRCLGNRSFHTFGFPDQFWCITIVLQVGHLQPAAQEVLLDLPGLLFFSTYTLLVLFWAEIYHQARSLPTTALRPIFISFNGLVYAVQVGFLQPCKCKYSLLTVFCWSWRTCSTWGPKLLHSVDHFEHFKLNLHQWSCSSDASSLLWFWGGFSWAFCKTHAALWWKAIFCRLLSGYSRG